MSEVTKVPARAKKPADRKPKKAKADTPVVEALDGAQKVTHKGIEVTIDDGAITNHLLMRAILRSESKSVSAEERLRASFDVFDLLFRDDADRILHELEGPDGYTDLTISLAFVTEILQALAPNS